MDGEFDSPSGETRGQKTHLFSVDIEDGGEAYVPSDSFARRAVSGREQTPFVSSSGDVSDDAEDDISAAVRVPHATGGGA